jgi:hypothetical protein
VHIHNETRGLAHFDGWKAFVIDHEERNAGWVWQTVQDPAGASCGWGT